MNLKRIAAAAIAALALTLAGTTAFAHHGAGGCHGYYQSRQPAVTYKSCPYEDCDETAAHTHGNDGCYYYGHYEGDGHTHCAAPTAGGWTGGYCHDHL